MEKTPQENYQDLMKIVRKRMDVIRTLKAAEVDDYSTAELAAFHGRKIIEAIAFGCLVATKNGMKHIPNDAEGQYNAEKILKTLSRKGMDVLQSPSEIAKATEEEKRRHNIKVTINGIPERRITNDEMIKKYQRMHGWLHELNPYTKEGQDVFYQKNENQLWADLNDLESFLESHLIGIKGQAFFCTLRDKIDGLTKVISLSKISDM
jgi:hypothetical protein